MTKALEQKGWTRQFVASEPRLSEAVEVYREAGFEVRLEPLEPVPEAPDCDACAGEEDRNECRACFAGSEDQYRVIFTRPDKDRPGPDRERS